MAGLDKNTEVVLNKNGVFNDQFIGAYVDSVFAANSNSIIQVNASTQKVLMIDPDLKILTIDQIGNITYRRVTAVKKIDLAQVPGYKVLSTMSRNGRAVTMGADTLLCSRYNNIIDSAPASTYAINDFVVCGGIGYGRFGSYTNLHEVQYNLDNTAPVPHVITGTWGEFSASKNDCTILIDVVNQNPDQCDPNDIPVFQEVLNENTSYDTLTNIINVTSQYTGVNRFLYDLETETGTFQFFNHYNFGTPQPASYQSNKLSKEKKFSASGNSEPVNVKDIINKFKPSV